MVDRANGEVRFEALGQSYRMVFSINGICALEDAAERSFMEVLAEMDSGAKSGKLRMSDIRLLFWAGLVEHHEGLTLVDAGRIVQNIGGLTAAQEMLEKAVAAAFPDDDAKGGAPEKPTAA